MSGSFQQFIAIGHLGGDPDIHTAASGVTIANFSIATSEKWKDKQTGDWQEETEWHNIVCFGKQAEVVQQYLKKGSRVQVVGKKKTDSWEDKNTGEKKYKVKIKCNPGGMLMLDSKNSNNGGSSGYNNGGGAPSYNQQPQSQNQGYAGQSSPPNQGGHNQNAPPPQNADGGFDQDVPF